MRRVSFGPTPSNDTAAWQRYVEGALSEVANASGDFLSAPLGAVTKGVTNTVPFFTSPNQVSFMPIDSAVLYMKTKVSIASLAVPSTVNAILVSGYNTPGDLGFGLYVRTNISAGAFAGVTDASGAFWRLSLWPGVTNICNYGAVGDFATDDAPAIAAAITDTPFGGSLGVPAANKLFLVQSTLTPSPRRVPIKLWGEGLNGSVIKAGASYPAGTPLFSINTSVFTNGFSFRDLQLDASFKASGCIGLLGSSGIYNTAIEQCFLKGALSGYVIFDDGTAAVSGTMAYSHISGCNLFGGVFLSSSGDGFTAEENIFTSNNSTFMGMYYNGTSGAAGFTFRNNVVAVSGVLLRVDRAVTPVVTGNEFETPFNVTFGGSTCIQFGVATGAGNLCRSPQFINNGISVLGGTGNPIPVYLNNVRNANVQGGRYLITLVGGVHVFIDSNAVNTFIATDVETEAVDGSGTVALKVTNGGTATIFQTNGDWGRTQKVGTTALATGVQTSVLSVVLSKGTWEVSGYVTMSGGAGDSLVSAFATLTTTAGLLGPDQIWMPLPTGGSTNVFGTIVIPPIRFNLAAAGTVFLDVLANHAVGTMTVTAGTTLEVRRAVMSTIF